MSRNLSRNLRLAIAVTLVNLWAFSHLARIPILGDMVVPLVVAPLLLYSRAQFTQPIAWRWRYGIVALVVVVVVVLSSAVIDGLVSPADAKTFSHSAYFVVPISVLVLVGLVGQATALEGAANS